MNYKEEICRSFETLREMITDRAQHDVKYKNIDLSKISDLEISQLASKQIFAINLSDDVRVVYNMAPKFKFTDIKRFVSIEADDTKITHILVLRDKMTGTNIKSLSVIKDVQVFDIKELLFNISKHELVPKHTVINDEDEISKILQKYSLKARHHLPIILKTDPMARYLALKPGNLVKIERVSPSAGDYVMYRCCT